MKYIWRLLLVLVLPALVFAFSNMLLATKYGQKAYAATMEVLFPEPKKPGPIRVKPGTDPKTTVIVTFDDGKKSSWRLFEIMQAYRLHCTHFVVPLRVGEPEYMTWGELRKILEWGCDIQSHSLTHPNLRELSTKQILIELNDSRTLIQSELGVISTVFATPEGEHDINVRMLIREAGYHAHVLGYGGVRDVNEVTEGMFNPFMLSRWDVLRNHVALDVCEAVKKAEERPQILIFVFHFGIKRPPEADAKKYGVDVYNAIGRMIPPEFHVFEDEFDKMMACIAQARDEGRVRVTSIPEALAYYRAMQEIQKTEAQRDLEKARAAYPANLRKEMSTEVAKPEGPAALPVPKQKSEEAGPKALPDHMLKNLLTIMVPEKRR